MSNLMRGHVPQETRIRYVITQGGRVPNVVPDVAEVMVAADPQHIVKAREEFLKRRGPGFVYKSRLDRAKPALDYRQSN